MGTSSCSSGDARDTLCKGTGVRSRSKNRARTASLPPSDCPGSTPRSSATTCLRSILRYQRPRVSSKQLTTRRTFVDLSVLVPHRELALLLCVRSRLFDSLPCKSRGISNSTLNSFRRHAEHFLVVVARRIHAFTSGSFQIYASVLEDASTGLVLGQNTRRTEERIGRESAKSETDPSNGVCRLCFIRSSRWIQRIAKSTTTIEKGYR